MTNDSSACPATTNVLDSFPIKRQALDAYIDGLPLQGLPIDKRCGFLIQCLHKAQGIFGFLPLELQELIATRLGLQQSDVYGVISFYSFFTVKPVGRNKINVCTGTACFVRGAGKIMEEFKHQLKIAEGETTEDFKFTLCSLRCVGACSLAPVVMVNDKVYGKVTPKMVAQIVKDCP